MRAIKRRSQPLFVCLSNKGHDSVLELLAEAASCWPLNETPELVYYGGTKKSGKKLSSVNMVNGHGATRPRDRLPNLGWSQNRAVALNRNKSETKSRRLRGNVEPQSNLSEMIRSGGLAA